MGKLIIFLASILLGVVGCSFNNNDTQIKTTGEVLVFSKPEDGAYLRDDERKNKSIAILKAGETLEVLDSYYGKDFLAYKIKTGSGAKGYIIHGESFDVLKGTNTSK